MNPNDNKNNKNNKPGGNWRGVASLVGWALLLTIIFSYASSVIGSTGRQASSINVEYGEFQEMVESGQVARVEFDNAEDILLITPEEGYSYTAEDGTVYTKTEDGYTYMDAAGQEQTAHLELFTVRIQSNDAVIDFLNEYGVEGVDKEYQAPVNPVLAMLVSYVLPFVLIFLMFSLVMRWMAKKGGMGGMGGIGGVGKANAKVYMEKSTGVTFKDVAGQDEAKESLTEIIDFLHNPQKYTEIGAKLPKGALLVGPPGTGANKRLDKGKMVAAFLMGSKKLYDFVDDNPDVLMRTVDYVNNPAVICQNPKVVSINSCLQVDFNGQVNSESMGTNQFSVIGGQLDYVRGAAMCPDGKAILAMPSTAKHGEVSRIVPVFEPGTTVTTTRTDVHYIVTEYGIANLRAKSLRERARLLISIAHPKFRDQLWEAYYERYGKEDQ